jgi:hypothetical protein
VNAREDDLGAGGTDVDADRHQRDIVLPPQRIILKRTVIVVKIVVVIVVGIVGVNMNDVAAVKVIGERVGRLLVFVVGHSLLSLGFSGLIPAAGIAGQYRDRDIARLERQQ